MPIPPISPAAPQQTQQTTTTTTSVTFPKLDGSSKDAASLDTAFEPASAKPLVDLSGGAKTQASVDASDDWEAPNI